MQELTFDQVEKVSGGSRIEEARRRQALREQEQRILEGTDGGTREVNLAEKTACLFLEGAAGGVAGHAIGKLFHLSSASTAGLVGGGVNVAAGGFGWCEALLSTTAHYNSMMIAP